MVFDVVKHLASVMFSYICCLAHVFFSSVDRMIIKYLIPVKLSIGILPKDWLLEKYNLVEVRPA